MNKIISSLAGIFLLLASAQPAPATPFTDGEADPRLPAGTFVTALTGTGINLRAEPSMRGQIVASGNIYEFYLGDGAVVVDPADGSEWRKLTAKMDHNGRPVPLNNGEIYVSAKYSKPLAPNQYFGNPDRPAASTCHFPITGQLPDAGGMPSDKTTRALRDFAAYLNGYIEKLASRPAMETDSIFYAESGLDPIANSRQMLAVKDVFSPLIGHIYAAQERSGHWWGSNTGAVAAALTREDAALIRRLEDYGFFIDSGEGELFFTWTPQALSDRMFPLLSDDMQRWRHVAASLPRYYFSDAACIYTREQMGGFAILLENYLKKDKDNLYKRLAINEYRFLLNFLMFSGVDNEIPFGGPNNTLSKEWADSLREIIRKNPGTVTEDILSDYMSSLKAYGSKYSDKMKNSVLKRMEDRLARF